MLQLRTSVLYKLVMIGKADVFENEARSVLVKAIPKKRMIFKSEIKYRYIAS